MNPADYNNLFIEDLSLTVRTYNALKRGGINTFSELLEAYKNDTLLQISNFGKTSYQEVLEAIKNVESGELLIAAEDDDYVVPEDLEDIPIDDLILSTRLRNRLLSNGYDTVGQMLRIRKQDANSIRGLGAETISELMTKIDEIKKNGLVVAKDNPLQLHIDDFNKRDIDTNTVMKLKKEYGFKISLLVEWYGITRSAIHQKLSSHKNRGNWLIHEMTESEASILKEMIAKRIDYFKSENGVQIYLLNNKKDDCVVIFVSDDFIKCFFTEMLSTDLQKQIKDNRLDCLSMEELEMMTSGKVSTILKQAYFFPANVERFRQLAMDRNMSPAEYCRFLTGMNYGTGQHTVDDERIVDFLRSHCVNGKIMIPSNNSTVWFRTFIKRHGYTIDEIAALYGFGENRHVNNEDTMMESIEEDMLQREAPSDDWIDRLFAEMPLLGNAILSEDKQDELYTSAKECVDKRLNDIHVNLSLQEEMVIALAVINYAKNWDVGDESGFWKYITSQFGYRDETNQLRGILCDCVLNATRKNHRLFISTSSGYQYKSTIVVHALTTQKTWMLFFDFLFDFYKTNLQWTYIQDDPIITRMVLALRNKLAAEEGISDDNIKISTKVYSFQEGISKLIIYRTGYAIKLVNYILSRIDNNRNHTSKPSEYYIDYLCDQWIERKIKTASDDKKSGIKSVSHRTVATDYTKIRPCYSLRDETNVLVSLPDIRLRKYEFEKVELNVYVGNTIIENRVLSFYGNELGKTLNGFDIDVSTCIRRGDGTLKIRIEIYCDDEKIYDSGEDLYREILCFYHDKECDVRDCKRSSYSFFTTKNVALDFVGAEVSEIDASDYWAAYFVRLGQEFLVKNEERILAYDNSDDSSENGIRVVYPLSESDILFVKNGQRFDVITRESSVFIIIDNKVDIKKYSIIMNGNPVSVNEIIPEKTDKGNVYEVQLKVDIDQICIFQIIDLEKGRTVSNRSIKLIPGMTVEFNRNFYFSNEDFDNAYVKVCDSLGLKEYDFFSNDDLISYTYNGGCVEIRIPRVIVRDSFGDKWSPDYCAWIKDVKQDEKIYVSSAGGVTCSLKLDSTSISQDEKGCFDLGNAVFAYSDIRKTDWISIILVVSQGKCSQEYVIGQLSPVERFINEIQFDFRDNSIYWNRGLGFIGNSMGNFKLRIYTPEKNIDYPLVLENELIVLKTDLPHNVYNCAIIKESENIFLGKETVLFSGTIIIGDKDELRFNNSMIRIVYITYEDDGKLRSVPINKVYIDNIKYFGIQFVDSEDRECPVYSGIMYCLDENNKRHTFAFNNWISEKGHHHYKINPVRIVFINERTLSITDEDGDGIYYYKYFNKSTWTNVYSITDREPNINNQDKYNLADLYTYKKERTE